MTKKVEVKTQYLVWTIVTITQSLGLPEVLPDRNVISMAEMQENWQVSKARKINEVFG
jgi:hypothetical protein